ncbi:hypothetical protein [Limnohabitans sp. JirII-29]|uniref:hypothetical protein n=1 Tax=Limnohabitans sp. JirII-29 TaxID=1835756 RepID=UPI0011B29CEF|nr:hypothetical protein [Limnohabitans sp. JirII-29]
MKSHTLAIDGIRSRVWLAEIRAMADLQPVHGIASRFDPDSIWRDDAGIPHQSKWYRYENGTAVPSEKLTRTVTAALPTLSFQVHHPVWTLLRNPKPSVRTIERMVAHMPIKWRQIFQDLKSEYFPYRQINLRLVSKYNMAEMSYLDALLLFELVRRQTSLRSVKKLENLTFVILVLPLLYIDDPVWKYQDAEQTKASLRTIVQSMRLSGGYWGEILFPVDRLVQAISMQRVLVERHLQRNPRALNTRPRRIRFLASALSNDSDEHYVIATTAFFREHPFILHGGTIFWNPDACVKAVWRRAWQSLKQDAKYSHFAGCLTRPSHCK